jgi:hypothetical protein
MSEKKGKSDKQMGTLKQKREKVEEEEDTKVPPSGFQDDTGLLGFFSGIFQPGIQPIVVKVFNMSCIILLMILFGMIITGSWNIHIIVMLCLSLGLFATMRWFLQEYATLRQNEVEEAKKVEKELKKFEQKEKEELSKEGVEVQEVAGVEEKPQDESDEDGRDSLVEKKDENEEKGDATNIEKKEEEIVAKVADHGDHEDYDAKPLEPQSKAPIRRRRHGRARKEE